jgi:hypothetical protein
MRRLRRHSHDLQLLRSSPPLHPFHPYTSVKIGVITNSDPRVRDILCSLDLFVDPSPDDYNLNLSLPSAPNIGESELLVEKQPQNKHSSDISFILTSYEAGFEKPDPAIFHSAKTLSLRLTGWEEEETDFVHVGDEIKKDIHGAENAGWGAVLLDREGVKEIVATDVVDGRSAEFVRARNGENEGRMVRIRDLRELVGMGEWEDREEEETGKPRGGRAKDTNGTSSEKRIRSGC